MKQILLSPFDGCGNEGTKKLNDSLRNAHLITKDSNSQHFIAIPGITFSHSFILLGFVEHQLHARHCTGAGDKATKRATRSLLL